MTQHNNHNNTQHQQQQQQQQQQQPQSQSQPSQSQSQSQSHPPSTPAPSTQPAASSSSHPPQQSNNQTNNTSSHHANLSLSNNSASHPPTNNSLSPPVVSSSSPQSSSLAHVDDGHDSSSSPGHSPNGGAATTPSVGPTILPMPASALPASSNNSTISSISLPRPRVMKNEFDRSGLFSRMVRRKERERDRETQIHKEMERVGQKESVYMQGLLTKRGGGFAGIRLWRTTRLFCLTDTALTYTDKSLKNIKGIHPVDTLQTVVALPSRRFPNRCFSLYLEGNLIFHLRAPSETECIQWMSALKKVIVSTQAKTLSAWRNQDEKRDQAALPYLPPAAITYPTLVPLLPAMPAPIGPTTDVMSTDESDSELVHDETHDDVDSYTDDETHSEEEDVFPNQVYPPPPTYPSHVYYPPLPVHPSPASSAIHLSVERDKSKFLHYLTLVYLLSIGILLSGSRGNWLRELRGDLPTSSGSTSNDSTIEASGSADSSGWSLSDLALPLTFALNNLCLTTTILLLIMTVLSFLKLKKFKKKCKQEAIDAKASFNNTKSLSAVEQSQLWKEQNIKLSKELDTRTNMMIQLGALAAAFVVMAGVTYKQY